MRIVPPRADQWRGSRAARVGSVAGWSFIAGASRS